MTRKDMRDVQSTQNRDSTKHLRHLSTYTKIGVQLMMFLAIVIVPKFFPSLKFEYHSQLTWNLFIILCLSIFFEIWTRIRERKNQDFRFIVSLQIITGVIMLSHFMHFLGRINGPLFIIYGLMIMESSLNLNITLPFIVVGIILTATIGEFVLLLKTGEIVLSLTNVVYVLARIAFVFLITNYGVPSTHFLDTLCLRDFPD